MHKMLDRLVSWLAEMLDRSMIMVPEIDELVEMFPVDTGAAQTQQNKL
jgi:hypothetical protein